MRTSSLAYMFTMYQSGTPVSGCGGMGTLNPFYGMIGAASFSIWDSFLGTTDIAMSLSGRFRVSNIIDEAT